MTDTESNWTNLTFDSQILSTFARCPQEMEYRFIHHYTPITGAGKAMKKGTLVHHGLEKFYSLMKEGLDWSARKAESIRAMREFAPTLDLDPEEILDTYRAYEEYCEYRKNDVFTVVFTERLFKFLAYEDPELRLRVYLSGRIDLGIIDGSNSSVIIPVDHKSESEAWFYTPLNYQFMIYALATGSKRLVVNRFGFQKTVKAEKKFKREDINFEKECLEEFQFKTLPYYAKQMLICAEENYYPMNLSNCVKAHFGCIFSDKYGAGICSIDPKLREQKLGMHFVKKEWNINED